MAAMVLRAIKLSAEEAEQAVREQKGACGGLYVEEDETKGVCKVSETDAKKE